MLPQFVCTHDKILFIVPTACGILPEPAWFGFDSITQLGCPVGPAYWTCEIEIILCHVLIFCMVLASMAEINFAVVLDEEESQDVYEYLPEEEQNWFRFELVVSIWFCFLLVLLFCTNLLLRNLLVYMMQCLLVWFHRTTNYMHNWLAR